MATEIRRSVMKFAEAMEEKLRANEHKKGWADCASLDLLVKLIKAKNELIVAVEETEDPVAIRTEAVDVANYCMMLFEISEDTEVDNGE